MSGKLKIVGFSENEAPVLERQGWEQIELSELPVQTWLLLYQEDFGGINCVHIVDYQRRNDMVSATIMVEPNQICKFRQEVNQSIAAT